MAKYQILVGVEHKNGEFLDEGQRSMKSYDNIYLYRNAELDPPAEGSDNLAVGYQSLEVVKIKYDDFYDLTNKNPEKFLAEVEKYLNKPIRIFFDEKKKPAMIQFVSVDPTTGEVK